MGHISETGFVSARRQAISVTRIAGISATQPVAPVLKFGRIVGNSG
jgi:hypothetical protein